MKAVFATLALAALASAHTQEEINRKGAEVMEEYRRDRGHWIHLSDMSHIDHMVDHIGKNGLAIGGFFITKDKYSSKKRINSHSFLRGGGHGGCSVSAVAARRSKQFVRAGKYCVPIAVRPAVQPDPVPQGARGLAPRGTALEPGDNSQRMSPRQSLRR